MLNSSCLRSLTRYFFADRRLRRRRKPTFSVEIQRLEPRLVLSASPNELLVFSVGGTAEQLPDVGLINPWDLVQYDGSQFALYFDGADVGLEGADIDALAILGEDRLLLSFSQSTVIEGIGTVGMQDVVLFEADSLGEETSGTFSRFFEGSTLGLVPRAGNIDAIDLLDDGSLVFSVEGNVTLPTGVGSETLSIRDADLVQFIPTVADDYSQGTLALLFDGSDVDLTSGGEDINGVSVDGSQIHFSTVSTSLIVAQNLSGSMDDVLTFQATSLGEETSGTYLGISFDGSVVAGTRFSLNALDFAPAFQATNPPAAEDFSLQLSEDTPTSIQLRGDDGDPDVDQPLTYVIVDGPDSGMLTNFNASTGTFLYTPNSNVHGTDQIIYQVFDLDENGNVLASELAIVDLTINPVNDVPVLQVSQSVLTGNQNVAVMITGVSVSDVEANADQSLVRVVLSVGQGSLSLPPSNLVEVTGSLMSEVTLVGTTSAINDLFAEGITFRPLAGFAGNVTLAITIEDSLIPDASLSATSDLQITVRSTADQTQAIREQIKSLFDSGEIRKSASKRLLSTLKGRPNERRIEATIRKVNRLIKRGKLDGDVGQSLIEQFETLQQGLAKNQSKRESKMLCLENLVPIFAKGKFKYGRR